MEIKIDPVTRLEGHAKIAIFLDNDGNVEDAYFQVVELRGFEEFCKGRPVEEMPRLVTRLCGVCPWPHHIASSKAVDEVFGVKCHPVGEKLRKLGYYAHMLESHIEHIYALGPAPDFLVGPDADPLKRNIFGVIEKVGIDIGKEVIKNRAYAVKIEDILGGKSTHPVYAIPGGVSHPLTEEDRKEILKMGQSLVDFSLYTIEIIDKFILKNEKYLDIILNKDIYYHETNYIGLVDENNKFNYYDGKFRVVSPDGKEKFKFGKDQYLDYIAEHVVSWSYLKVPYLKKIGWKGFVDGPDSGIMRAAPLGRLNASEGFTTPKAQKVYEDFFDFFNAKPVHHTLTFHWARAIECVYSAEMIVELCNDPEITNSEVRNIPESKNYKGEGIGAIEAPRGCLIHHYKTDENNLITDINLVVASAFNYGAMNMSVKKAAQALIKDGKFDQGILNMVEMAFRNYDPCFSCATHYLPGTMPIKIEVLNKDGEIIDVIKRD